MYSTNSKEMYFIDTEKMENEAIETGDKKRGTILIVEDNQEIRHYLSSGLAALFNILEAGNGATSVETAALLSKKALMRPLGSHNENERAAYMEKLLEDGINSIGLGPQGMGGKYSVMGVHIENTARHPSAIGVAVNVGCWSHRRGHIIFDKDLNYTIDTHSGVTL